MPLKIYYYSQAYVRKKEEEGQQRPRPPG